MPVTAIRRSGAEDRRAGSRGDLRGCPKAFRALAGAQDSIRIKSGGDFEDGAAVGEQVRRAFVFHLEDDVELRGLCDLGQAHFRFCPFCVRKRRSFF